MTTRDEIAPATPWRRALAEIRAAAAPGGRRRHGTCVIEGLRLCERALRAGARIHRAVHDSAFLDDSSERVRALRHELTHAGCELVEIPEQELARLTEGRSLGGLVATAARPPEPGLEDLLRRANSEGVPLRLVVCVGFNDPGNVGALVRTAHAMGAHGLITVGATGAFHPKAIRTSMGSVFRLPVLESPTSPDDPSAGLASLLAQLRQVGVRSVGAVTRGPVLDKLTQRGRPLALVFGSEAFGLGAEEQAQLDELVSIPMAGEVDSLSVNAAAAIVLHELRAGGPFCP